MRHINFVISFVISVAVCQQSVIAENQERGYLSFGFNVHYGNMLPHYQVLADINKNRITTLELTAWFRGENEQQGVVAGLGYVYSGLGNSDILGHMHALYGAFQSVRLSKSVPLHLKMGLGAAYVTETHTTNSLNPAIGSHLNAYGQMALTGRIPFRGRGWWLTPGLSFQHISNGAIVAPNQGLNLLALHLGVDFQSSQSHHRLLRTDPAHKNSSLLSFFLAPGIKQVHRSLDYQIFTSSAMLEYSYGVSAHSSIGLGLNFFYNDTWGHFPYHRSDQAAIPAPYQLSLHLLLHYELGPVTMLVHPGAYLYKPADDTPWFTSRLGVRCKFYKGLSAHFAIKHHWFALADYFEWGLGYGLGW